MYTSRIHRSKFFMGGSILLAIASLAWLAQSGNEEAFNIVLGVIVGAAATSVPQAFSRHTDRLLRARAAARLIRSDLYAYQDWILDSIKAGRWGAPPDEMATPEHYGELAYLTGPWRQWEPLSRARRSIAQLRGYAESRKPRECIHPMNSTMKATDTARKALSKIDDGRSEPRYSEEIFEPLRDAVEVASAGSLTTRRQRRSTPSIGALFRRR